MIYFIIIDFIKRGECNEKDNIIYLFITRPNGILAADSANYSQVLRRCSDRDICIDLCLDELGAPEPYAFWNCVNSCLSKIARSDCDD